MSQIWGDFREDILAKHQLFSFEFYIDTIPPERRKQTRYLIVAFITDYLANLFPTSEEDIHSFEKHLTLKSAATYLTNELLENSIKFHHGLVNFPITFAGYLLDKCLIFATTNSAQEKSLEKLNIFLNELINSDIDELYFRQLEKGAEEKSDESGLGLLSMINDYSAKLGWKIETVNQDPQITTVTTMVQLAI
ncbi:MAG TPA: ATP-binding protein [Cyanobacteria bacterium UBA8803]|nr:ATP-binding protein [Cyanobacteria bacterium UBA9273]HBL60664.1 ATP-binding protein [Cyanobacteria bacterium UBA8803]